MLIFGEIISPPKNTLNDQLSRAYEMIVVLDLRFVKQKY
jgi:hypothetical protein